MELEEALKTAIEYETRIRDFYRQAAKKTSETDGRNLFQQLAEDEQRHLNYLESRLIEWEQHGAITSADLTSALPNADQIARSMASVAQVADRDDRGDEKQMLSRALNIEIATSAFYKELTETIEGESATMFARFLKIEEDHVALVQAELDYLSHTGYWFDIKEFDMEDY
jgi:rubrerythrin